MVVDFHRRAAVADLGEGPKWNGLTSFGALDQHMAEYIFRIDGILRIGDTDIVVVAVALVDPKGFVKGGCGTERSDHVLDGIHGIHPHASGAFSVDVHLLGGLVQAL